jgi:hypothetical protein
LVAALACQPKSGSDVTVTFVGNAVADPQIVGLFTRLADEQAPSHAQ